MTLVETRQTMIPSSFLLDSECSSRVSFEGFPPEIWERFLSYLPTSDLLSLASCSKECSNAVYSLSTFIHMKEPIADQFDNLITNFKNLTWLSIDNPMNLNQHSMVLLARLSRLRTLRISDISHMDDPASVLRSIWSLSNLTDLILDFGNETSMIDYTSIICLVALKNLKYLSLYNIPDEWNDYQNAILSSLGELVTLNLSFVNPPVDLSDLKLLTKLKQLSVRVSGSPFSMETNQPQQRDSNSFIVPALPNLRTLSLPNGTISSASIGEMHQLKHLEFTPWGWRKDDLNVFVELEQLRHLTLRVNWLPNADCIAKLFKNLVSLTLVEFDVSRCLSLAKLVNLQMLCIDSPSRAGKGFKKSKHLQPVAELLNKMTWLQAFSLVNSPHLTPQLAATISKHPSIRHLEVSGCRHCMNQLFVVTKLTSAQINTLFVHCTSFTFEWLDGMNTLETLYLADTDINSDSIAWYQLPALTRVETNSGTFWRPARVEPTTNRMRSMSI